MCNKARVMVMMIVFVLSVVPCGSQAGEKLMIMCGAAFKMPMEEIVAAFTEQTGTEVNVSYAGGLFCRRLRSASGRISLSLPRRIS